MSIQSRLKIISLAVLWCASVCAAGESVLQRWAKVVQGRVPHETGAMLNLGTSYDWSRLNFALIGVQALFDYDAVWPHPAPEALSLRLESSLGLASGSEFSGPRLMASAGFLAVYQLEALAFEDYQPYVEAGVGIIYTDFQRPGQGLRINFNPQAGIGIRKGARFVTLRLHHISNANLNKDNRGINSIMLGVGWYFGD